MPSIPEVLASYVPDRVFERLATAPAAPFAEQFDATVLFADISGSTALAEKLAEQGAMGPEEFGRILNAYLGTLIDQVVVHGGDVVKFAGDGLFATWPASERADAAHCALAAQQAVQDVAATQTIRLAVRVGIATGTVTGMALEVGADHLEFLVVGQPVLDACQAEAVAPLGGVVIAAPAWRLFADCCEGDARADGSVQLRTVRIAPASPRDVPRHIMAAHEPGLRRYAPPAIAHRLAAGHSEWLAELRRLSVLFVQLPAWDATSTAEATAQLSAIRAVLERREGVVARLGIQPDGPALMAAFGLPPLAHEDDPPRCAQAALEIAAALRALGVAVSIGVASGRAFCGAIGTQRRREYTMVGDAPNVAARLMQAAQGGILCDAATQAASGARLTFTALPALSVKGKTEPLAVYRPAGPRAGGPTATTPLIGRTAERQRLQQHVDALRNRTAPRVLVIEGEAGIGKSRLVTLLRECAGAAAIPVRLAAGDAVEHATAYYGWRPIVAQLFEFDTLPDARAARRGAVLQRLAAMQSDADPLPLLELAPLLNAVVPLDIPETALTSQMSPEARADNTHALLVRLLHEASPEPSLLILEDAHWLDSPSWIVTRLAVQHVPNVYVVLVMRPFSERLSAEYQRLQQVVQIQRLVLQPLSGPESASLLKQRLGVQDVSAQVADFVFEKSDGHPYFAEELARALRDSGAIITVGDTCRTAPAAGDLRGLQLPDTLQGIITGRIDRLPAPQQLVLKVASVFGHDFTPAALRDIYPLDADRSALDAHLDALARIDLLRCQSEKTGPTYVFAHAVARDVAYGLMTFSQRRRLHRVVAEWYERTHPDLAAIYPLLAYHWDEAARADPALVEPAVAALEKAGEQAFARYANNECVAFLTRAVELAAITDRGGAPAAASAHRRGRWERQLGEAYFGLGKVADARAHLERGLQLLGESIPAKTSRLAFALAREMTRQIAHRMAPRAFRGRSPVMRRPTLLEAAAAYTFLHLITFITLEQLLAVYAIVRGLNVAELATPRAARPTRALVFAYHGVGLLAGFLSPRVAEGYLRRAAATAAQLDELRADLGLRFGKGYCSVRVAAWAQAEEGFRAARDVAAQLGDRRFWELSTMQIGNVGFTQGDFIAGLERDEEAYASAYRRGDLDAQVLATVGKVTALAMLGRTREAAASLASLEAWIGPEFDPILDRAIRINAYAMRALLSMRQGLAAPALKAAGHAADLIAQSPVLAHYALVGYASTAEVLLTLWEADALPAERARIERLGRGACAGLKKLARVFAFGRAQALIWQGLCDWLTGYQRRANVAWQRALTAATHFGLPYEEGLAHFEIGRHVGEHATARVHLQRAIECFQRVQARDRMARAQALLDAGPDAVPTIGAIAAGSI